MIVFLLLLFIFIYSILRHRFRLLQFLPYWVSLILFLSLGWGISTIQQNSFDRYARQLDTAQFATGEIVEVKQFSRMTRLRVRLPLERWWCPPHYFLVIILESEPPIREGHTIHINKRLSPIPPAEYPFGFDGQAYWNLHHTSHQVFLYNTSDIEILNTQPYSAIQRMREQTLARMDTLYPNPDQAGILKALVTGDRRGLTDDVKNHFKNAGLLHILAVSGLHVGIVFGLLYLLLFPLLVLHVPRGVIFGIMVIALWVYAGWTGLNIPVIRAVILLTFYLTAARLRRQSNPWNIYFWAVFIVLLLHPESLFTVSMQLSYGAVAAILLFFKPIHRYIIRFFGQNYFTSLIAVSIAAQLGVIPFLIWHFQEVSMVSTLSGFVVIPLLFPVILFSTASVVIPSSIDWFRDILSSIAQVLVQIIVDLSDIMAHWSFSTVLIVWHPITITLIILAIVLGGISLGIQHKGGYRLMGTVATCLICLSVLTEIGNIYHKRSRPQAIVLEYRNEKITELYYKGWCYTNFNDPPPAFLERLRQKHYTKGLIAIEDQQSWNELVSNLTPGSKKNKVISPFSIQVANYITGNNFEIIINESDTGPIPSIKSGFPPAFSNFNNQ